MTATGWLSNGVSFDDYGRMQTLKKKTSGERRLPTPMWALNNPALRRVIVQFMEERAFSKKERLKIRGGLKRRLENAKVKIISKRPAAIVILDRLCAEYVTIKQKGLKPGMTDTEWNASKNQPYMSFAEGEARYQDELKRLRQLEVEIEGIDTYLRISENGGADILVAAVYLYYRVGMDSVGVASELGLKSPHIRQTLYRLHQTAKRLWPPNGNPSQMTDKKRAETNTGKAHKGITNRAGKFVTPPLF
jgi:hypothetical protein